jgi:hypothetical protein
MQFREQAEMQASPEPVARRVNLPQRWCLLIQNPSLSWLLPYNYRCDSR